jgi:integrase
MLRLCCASFIFPNIPKGQGRNMSIRKRTWQTESGEERSAYVVQYSTAERDERGKRKRHIKTFDRKKDADDFHAQVRIDLKKGVHTPDSKSITVEEAGTSWIDGCRDLERTSVDQYNQHLKFHINPYLGMIKLPALTTAVVREWQDKLRKGVPAPGQSEAAPRSAAMVKKVTTSLSSLLSDAMERGKVAHNVVRSMAANRRKRKVERRQKRKLVVGRDIPKQEEIDALLQHTTDDRWRAFLLTAIRCGLRASELRGLRWEDIDFNKSELHVRQRADRYGTIGNPKVCRQSTRCADSADDACCASQVEDSMSKTGRPSAFRFSQRFRKCRDALEHHRSRFDTGVGAGWRDGPRA